MTRVLHVAALPFPSPQGTQAALRRMLQALARRDRSAQLLTYAHGQGVPPREVRVQRLRDRPRVRSLRSGPSLGKLALDAQLAWTLPRRGRRVQASLLMAHHVEAAVAAWLRSPTPWVFFAHTDLQAELPVYAPARWGGMLSRLGGAVEGQLLREARAVATISPLLAERFARRHGATARYVPTPWPLADPVSPEAREHARQRLRLPPGARTMLYAGNLDAYQGWPACVEALACARIPGLHLVVATASHVVPLETAVRRAGVGDRLRVVPLGTERDRRAAHAAADVALIPRRIAGGLPIKLLDSLSRGLPTVAMRGAAAGLPIEHAAWLCDDRTDAFTAAVEEAFRRERAAEARARHGRRYVAFDHADERFLEAYDAVCRDALRWRSQLRMAA